MRVDGFKATNLRQLDKKTDRFPWELYIPKGVLPQIKVTSRHSRLFHTDAIADVFTENIAHRMNGIFGENHKDAGAGGQKLFVR